MAHLQSITAFASDTGTTTNWLSADTTSASNDQYIVAWHGMNESTWDGYEYRNGRDEWAEFQIDTRDFPHQIEWGNEHRSWIKVHMLSPSSANTVYDNQTVATGNDIKTFCFYYRWTENYPAGWPQYDHIHNFTVNFAPIAEEQEVAPETFMKWLEKLGHDEAFVRMQYRMQKKMMKHVGHLPPWDPRKIAELEERRVQFADWLEKNGVETKQKEKERLKERWGIEEIPPMTPELLDQIANQSLQFLESCLSPEEMKFFDEHGHCKIPSPTEPEVYYIVKVTEKERVERYEKDQLAEKICIHSKWGGLPPLDTVAMKALYIKNAEKEFLKVGNRTRVVRR